MSRVSKCDKLPEHERLRLVGCIGEGMTWEALAAEFNIPFSTIREWATRNGYSRSPVDSKRQLVDRLLAKPQSEIETANKTVTLAESTGNPDTDAAAERDAKVARLAANVAVQIIKRLAELAKFGDGDAKEASTIAVALDKAWGTYARINKLDDQPQGIAAVIKLVGTE